MTLDGFNEEVNEVLRLRRTVIRRDHQRCVRCKKPLNYRRCVVIPINKDIEFKLDNLVTLCHLCKHWIETHQNRTPMRTRSDVAFSMRIPEILTIQEDQFQRPAWHAWVYGSAKPPGVRR